MIRQTHHERMNYVRHLSEAGLSAAETGTPLQNFEVEDDQILLPRGAAARARRVKIGWRGRSITAQSQGDYRSYLYPVFTPSGTPVTAETPMDHPHHQSMTIGADHVNCLLPYSTNKLEEANYSFYVNYTLQGRAPGRIVSEAIE